MHNRIILGIKFHFEQFCIFGANLPTKDVSSLTQTNKKIKTTTEFCIFELEFVQNFCLNRQISFF